MLKPKSRIVSSLVPFCLAAMLSATLASSARADESDKALAEQLFIDAKKLMDKGEYAQACPKLEESLRLEPADGTLLRYALCEEKNGKLATAWARFKEGLANAKKANNAERIKFANEHIADIEPKLSKVTIRVPESAQVEGLEVRWDGKAVGKSAWDLEFPVDAGSHTLSATAPGKQLWTTTVGIGPNADRRAVEVPALVAPPPSPTVATEGKSVTVSSTPTDTPKDASVRKTPALVYVLGTTGVVLLGGSVVAYLAAARAHSAHHDYCSSQITVDCTGDDDTVSSGKRWQTISFISAGLGIAAIATGVTIYFTSRSTTTPASVGLTPATFAGGGGLRLQGSF